MKKLISALLVFCGLALGSAAQASEAGHPWDKFPAERVTDVAALQRGAKLFVNYCLNCHSAAYMRYNRMQDIGLTELQIKQNLLFATEKVGDTMKVSLEPKNAKEWFGAVPPDLTLVARSRAGQGGSGADYLYTYMRTFYRDDT
ncbi:MAG: cytochrome c1, partial [Aquabacterium sp.]